jgi:uncharacterized protein (DUF1919 family)
MKRLSFSINVQKINKDLLNATDKGTWLNGVIFMNDTVDQYGSIGFIAEKAKPGEKGTILGQIKIIEEKKLDKKDLPF